MHVALTWKACLAAVTPQTLSKVLHLQDANVFVSEADAGISQQIQLGPNRQAYLVCIEGNLDVNDKQLTTRDAIEIVSDGVSEFPVHLTAGKQGSHFLVIEMLKA